MLDTYKKRSGTDGSGKDYEYTMCAFYAIKLSTDTNIRDFVMTTNDEQYGDFDDIFLEVTFEDQTKETYILQLKHKESCHDKYITDTKLADIKGDFGLVKYMRTFQKIEHVNDKICVLYTNAKTKIEDKSKFKIEKAEKNGQKIGLKVKVVEKELSQQRMNILTNNNNNNTKTFQFLITKTDQNQVDFQKVEEFCKQFYFFPDQDNIHKVKETIKEKLSKILKADIYKLFIVFMKEWWEGNFFLTKRDVLAKLAELALKEKIVSISFSDDTEIEHFTELVKKFEMTIVKNPNNNVIQKIWPNPKEDKNFVLAKKKFKTDCKYITLWFLDQIPLIVRVTEETKAEIKLVIKLLENSNHKKIILLGDISGEEFPKWKILENLSDLSSQDEDFCKNLISKNSIHIKGTKLQIEDKRSFVAVEIEDILKLLSKNTNSISVNNIPVRKGLRRLHVACKNGDYSTVNNLLEEGVDVKAIDDDKNTALHHAMSSRLENVQLLRLLIGYGAEIDAQNNKGVTPLHIASKENLLESVKLLQEKGADVNICDSERWNALHYAAFSRRENVKVIEFLMGLINVNSTTNDGRTPFLIACKEGFIGNVKQLSTRSDLQAVDYNSWNAFHYAAFSRFNNTQVINFLKTQPINVKALDVEGSTPLHLACKEGYIENVEMLFNLDQINFANSKRWTPLHFAAFSRSENTEVLNFLLQKGANVNARDDNGTTPLHLACKEGFIKNVTKLIDFQADVSATNDDNWNVLHFAAAATFENTTVLGFLIKHVDVNSRNEHGSTALHLACKEGFISNVKLLFDKGAKKRFVDDKGSTVLHYAAASEKKNEDVIRFLIEKKVDVNAVDDDGVSAWDLIRDKNLDVRDSFDGNNKECIIA